MSRNICEILLYGWQLVVLIYELIYAVRDAHHWGKVIVKQDYSYLVSLQKIFDSNRMPDNTPEYPVKNIRRLQKNLVQMLVDIMQCV